MWRASWGGVAKLILYFEGSGIANEMDDWEWMERERQEIQKDEEQGDDIDRVFEKVTKEKDTQEKTEKKGKMGKMGQMEKMGKREKKEEKRKQEREEGKRKPVWLPYRPKYHGGGFSPFQEQNEVFLSLPQ